MQDVAHSAVFDPSPNRDVMLAAGVRAVRSIPLLSPDGFVLGIFSVHYRRPHRPDAAEQNILAALGASAVRRLLLHRTAEALIRLGDRECPAEAGESI